MRWMVQNHGGGIDLARWASNSDWNNKFSAAWDILGFSRPKLRAEVFSSFILTQPENRVPETAMPPVAIWTHHL